MSIIDNIDEDEEENQDIVSYKIILLGDTAVGKTSLILRFCNNEFQEKSIATVGVDTKKIYYKYQDKKMALDIWDTAGQERFKSLAKNSFKGADGIILVYDLAVKKTFQNIKNWYNNIKESIDISNVAIIIVGNKSDIPDKEVKKEISDKFCEQYKLQTIETSCKDNINVHEAFNLLIEEMLKLDDAQKQQNKRRQSKLGASTFSNHKKGKKKCC
jgi:small GTP-binding protein